MEIKTCPQNFFLWTEELEAFLSNYHEAFHIEKQDEETANLVEIEIHTGDAVPSRVRRMPLAVQREVKASPVVTVCKKDGTWFCSDYCGLNVVTKAFPFHALTTSMTSWERYFSTLHLVSGYWQFMLTLG